MVDNIEINKIYRLNENAVNYYLWTKTLDLNCETLCDYFIRIESTNNKKIFHVGYENNIFYKDVIIHVLNEPTTTTRLKHYSTFKCLLSIGDKVKFTTLCIRLKNHKIMNMVYMNCLEEVI